MLAGLLAGSGYNLGAQLHPASEWNPKGFFEDQSTTATNDKLLWPYVEKLGAEPGPLLRRLAPGEAWLACLPPALELEVPAEIERAIALDASTKPLCRKDPRFCYTLPAWLPYLDNPLFICIFRDPVRTARSIEKFGAAFGLGVSFGGAVSVWRASYSSVLRHAANGEWLFVHYEQIARNGALPRLESALGMRIASASVDPAMQSVAESGVVDSEAASLYEELCSRAGYETDILLKS